MFLYYFHRGLNSILNVVLFSEVLLDRGYVLWNGSSEVILTKKPLTNLRKL